ncbi:desmocollin 2-like protein [Genypterus blacodes]|uniref:desmocollin 2-like protein n=1 Tax=Genypterus blacodes TaxID=154954 RepID=UPI003F77249B
MVAKQLDYEVESVKNLSISVENEIPYQSCKVQRRNTNGAWDVVKIEGEPGTGLVPPLSVRRVTLRVEDVNEPPFFTPSVKDVRAMENVPVGHYLETFTAKDLDFKSHVKYRKGEDPADWVTVDPKTGKVTTSKVLDRESSFVKNNVYKATVYAVDNGLPPLTGTATLNIHIKDENDNVPSLLVNFVDICQSDGPTRANITAFDLDEEPYSGPFRFKLHGDVKGKWRVEPTYGYSVSLIKEKTVHSGHHELVLEVSDLQDHSAKHNLSIAVCECLDARRPNCRIRKAASSSAGGAVLGIMFFAALLVVGVLLLALLLSCKRKTKDIPDEGSGEHLMISNTEIMGVDCEVVFHPSIQGNCENMVTATDFLTVGTRPPGRTTLESASHLRRSASVRVSESFHTNKDLRQGAAGYQHRHSKYRSWAPPSKYSMRQQQQHPYVFTYLLDKMLFDLQAREKELDNDTPHLYADEGRSRTNTELDAISITEIPFDPELDLDLDRKFTTLASMCMPDPSTA